MKHAGVAVTVTTFTDVIAFLVGSNTLLPVLQSFCVYAAISIFTIYALQVTHFVAWFSLGKWLLLFCPKVQMSWKHFQHWKTQRTVLICCNISDQRREQANRDGCLCCIVHTNFKSEQSKNTSMLNKIFGQVGKLLTKNLVKVVVIVLSVLFLSIGIWGTLSLTQVSSKLFQIFTINQFIGSFQTDCLCQRL